MCATGLLVEVVTAYRPEEPVLSSAATYLAEPRLDKELSKGPDLGPGAMRTVGLEEEGHLSSC